MQNYIAFLSIVASLGVYFFAVRSNKASATSDQYFTARGTVDSNQFANAQIAYALQMATVYPFFLFAFQGMWWVAVINTLFYSIGIALYRLLLGKFARGARPLLGSARTVHAAIAEVNHVPFLRPFTAGLTVFAFAGLAAFEIIWGANALKIALGGNEVGFYLSVATLAAYLVVYVWAGGQNAAIRADQIQLFFSYVGLHVLVAWVAWQPGVDLAHLSFPLVAPLIVAISGVMLIYRLRTVPWATTRAKTQ